MILAARVVIVLSILSFAPVGCTPAKQSLQATWYIVQDENPEADGRMYVALLNQGAKEITVRKVVINANEDGSNGWTWDDRAGFLLDSGGVRFLCVKNFYRATGGGVGKDYWMAGDCRVPVTVRIETGQDDPIVVEVVGAMPSAVPHKWEEKCCKPALMKK